MSIKHSTEAVEKTLSVSPIHDDWADKYRNSDNIKFFEMAFSHILSHLRLNSDAKILEVGCGTCTKSIIMVDHGFYLKAVDVSEEVLEKAKENIKKHKLQDKISLKQGNVLDLEFEDNSFDCVLVWGVLMHVPELETALIELSRVVKTDGVIIVAENNMFSVQSLFFKLFKFISRRDNVNVNITPSGRESWSRTAEGSLLVREMNIRWFKRKMAGLGFSIEMHISGQFSELYTLFSSSIIKKSIHFVNYLWFRYVRVPDLALGNVIILRKNRDDFTSP